MRGADDVARVSLSAELRLVLACCRWPVNPEAVTIAARRPIDWNVFLDLLERHGVVALAANALRAGGVEPPQTEAERLNRANAIQVRRSLSVARETSKWARRFEEHGIGCRFFKGATLAQLAYGNLALKRSGDIDVIVASEQAMAAHALLNRSGFSLLQNCDVDLVSLARFWRWGKEVTYGNEDGNAIDLHVRLSDNQRLLETFDAGSARQEVIISGTAVATFADPFLYAYLCYHGAVHGWSRLKWLADLGAFVDRRDISSLHAVAIDHGLGRASRVALHLCHHLLGCEAPDLPPPTALERLHIGIALASINHRHGGSDVRPLTAMNLALLGSHLVLADRLAALPGALGARWRQPAELARYTSRSAVIYHLLRIPRFILRLPGKVVDSHRPRKSVVR